MDEAQLKKKLRDLKRLEIQVRFPGVGPSTGLIDEPLVWDDYFTDRSPTPVGRAVRFPFETMRSFGREERKQIFEEFLVAIYLRAYADHGLGVGAFYNPDLLRAIGLSPGVTRSEIKTRFRELAKRYHPDHGGAHDEMVKLLEAMDRLLHQ